MDKQLSSYQITYNLVRQVEKLLLNKYGVKVVGMFTDKVAPITIALSFATERKAERLVYTVEEIMKGIKPESIVAILEEKFGLL